ncbi:hypothetical protein, partial [Mitsuokella multacida]|uniref:hypothetical protein n=1 Tax=Mitsuokella multacida TaxID=52226 RepID=UPI00265AE1D7
CDSLINSQVLYRLSYRGISTTCIIIESVAPFVNTFFSSGCNFFCGLTKRKPEWLALWSSAISLRNP